MMRVMWVDEPVVDALRFGRVEFAGLDESREVLGLAVQDAALEDEGADAARYPHPLRLLALA